MGTKAATRTATTTTLTITTTPSPTLSPQTRLIGVGCCRGLQKGILNGWKKGILMSWKNRTWADCAQSCAEHPACNAFAASGCASRLIPCVVVDVISTRRKQQQEIFIPLHVMKRMVS